MKTPRLTDFDPDAKTPKLGSPLDNMPTIQNPQNSPTTKVKKASIPTSPTPVEELQGPGEKVVKNYPSVLPSVRTPVRRTVTRYAFEFFQDQIESLREFSLEEKIRGEKGSMSEMVREAIDAYITKRRRLED